MRNSVVRLGLAPICGVMLAGAGCDSTRRGTIEGEVGVPKVDVGGQSGPVTAKFDTPNPCEIDVDYGTLTVGQTALATLKVENTGSGALDLLPFDAGLSHAFDLDYGDQASIPPGQFNEFTVAFAPTDAGQASWTFVIPTNGVNRSCPAPEPDPDGANSVTVKLTGTGSE